MKINLEQLSIRNFMSFGNADQIIELEQPGTTLIVGEDLDNVTNGKTANGVGKSSIVNALTYALYDKPVSNISKDKLVNNINNKNMVVKLLFSIGENKYQIIRERKTKAGAAGNNVTLFKNGVDITRGAAETNADIEAILGIPHELFVRIIVFSASHIPFLDLPATAQVGANQKDFIEELFGLTALTTKSNMLKEVMRDTRLSIDTKRIVIRANEGEHERHEVQIDNAKKRVISWESTNAENIMALKNSLSEIQSVDVAAQKKLHVEMGVAKQSMRDAQAEVRQLKSLVDQLSNKKQKLSSEIADLHDDTCPYCKQEYAGSEGRVTECLSEQSIVDQELNILLTKKEVAEQSVDKLITTTTLIESQITVADIDHLIQIASEREAIEQKITDMSQAINPHLDSLDELESIVLPSIDYTEVNELERLLSHQEFLLKLLTKKDSFIRKALLDKSIPYLNTQLKRYLAALGLPHSVVFTQEMTAAISRFGTQLDFGNLSTGQRARVNLALSFAFRNVLQNLHSSVNVCMLDEVFDFGLDAAGVQLAVRLVKQKTREENLSMYIISHREEVSTLFDHVMKVEFSKGFSTIVAS